MQNLPKHPLERDTVCPVCKAAYKTIPTRRGTMPDDHSVILEQHVCPNGHVYVTEIGGHEMLPEW